MCDLRRLETDLPGTCRPWGEEVFPEKFGGAVRPPSQYPYRIYDQNPDDILVTLKVI